MKESNLFLKCWVLGDRAITRKMTETLHYALSTMTQFSVSFFLSVILHHKNKINIDIEMNQLIP
jgi:hypothetical protein